MEAQVLLATQLTTECYNVTSDPNNEDDPRAINIPESKGIWDISTPKIPSDKFKQLLEIWKVNIGMTENPKFANIVDYWDEVTMVNITDLLHKF